MTEENPYATPEADVAVASDTDGGLASRWARLGGSFIDGIIAMVIIWPLMYYLEMFDWSLEQTAPYQDTALGGLIGFSVFLVLNGYLLATRGQTIGKVVAMTRIVSIEDRRILPLWKVILMRVLPGWIASVVPLAGPFLNIIDALFIFRPDRRCVHDHIAGTVVIWAR